MITMGLAEMHRKFIIHFDLKPENIFLFGDKYVKIGDFGTSVSLGSDKNKVKKLVGTQYYVSPEMLDGEPCVNYVILLCIYLIVICYLYY